MRLASRRSGRTGSPRARRPAYAAIALRQFTDPLVLLLIVAALISALIGERIEAAAIGAIVLLNAALGFGQEAKAEGAILALRDVLERRATVVRPGVQREVAVEQIVPGDLVVVRDGEWVPADGRLVAAAGLAVDESTLTGESCRSKRRSKRSPPRHPSPTEPRSLRRHGRDPGTRAPCSSPRRARRRNSVRSPAWRRPRSHRRHHYNGAWAL